jgi:hypothetical protein
MIDESQLSPTGSIAKSRFDEFRNSKFCEEISADFMRFYELEYMRGNKPMNPLLKTEYFGISGVDV